MSTTAANVIEITDENFEQVVIEGSKDRPVVVDLWASWCGPCRTLGPILEKVASERDGAFLLGKLDVDANPGVASMFGVQSIPTVIAFRDGQPVTGFVGAYPEPAVNQFIDSLLPTESELVAEEAQAEAEAGDVEGAEQRFREALERDPENVEAKIGLARLLAAAGELDEAEDLARPLLPNPDAERAMATVRVRRWAATDEPGTLAAAKRLAAQGKWREALDGMLGALAEDRDAGREAMVDVFAVLGDEDPLVPEYRRRLASALF
ncbi:MAG: thioredoxin [Actinobacteria bacterium]|nr:thioredoxin [Actinomycetota bacterium]